MTEQDRFDWWMLGIVAMLGIGFSLHSSMFRMLTDKVIALNADVEFLKDHTVARETEARP